MFGSDDITWCASKCSATNCFRHPTNIKHKAGLHSYAEFKNTEDCPFSRVEVTTQERGWAGHLIYGGKCLFRRNTLVTCGNIKWVVSTVGGMRSPIDIPLLNIKAGQIEQIGADRWYETMVFESLYDEYDDADVSKQISFEHDWGIFGKTWEEVEQRYGKDIDNVANRMHDEIVEEIKLKIKEAYINAKTSNPV
jgi:hypothetical protein